MFEEDYEGVEERTVKIPHIITDRDEFIKDLYDPKKLNQSIKSVDEKWRLLPAFIKVKGIVRQHIESFNYFLEVEMQKIVATSNVIMSSVDPSFVVHFKNVSVETPSLDQNFSLSKNVSPQMCRLRDLTYTSRIMADVEYTHNRERCFDKVCIGRIPMMLGCNRCVLYDKPEEDLAKLGECPQDPGGYFIIRGVEKVILIHEQLSNNRIILETNSKGFLNASVTSSTHERKSRTDIFLKNGCFYIKSSSFSEDIPFVIVMKAMGIESDQEIIQLVGSKTIYASSVIASVEECAAKKIYSQFQALDFIGGKIKVARKPGAWHARRPRARHEEARDTLAAVILSHIPVENYDFRPKAIFAALMVRRLIQVFHDSSLLDDKDYYGNKRLQLAGQLVSLLFEDLFKQYCSYIKTVIDNSLAKANQAQTFLVTRYMKSDIITKGLSSAISSGNWTLKRFKMERAGITALLSRQSFIAALGCMTKIQSQFEKTRKVSGPRSLQASQWGMVCPSDTPEGANCGLAKNLALLTQVTIDEEPYPIQQLAYSLGVEDIELVSGDDLYRQGTSIVFLNGTIIGVHRNWKKFIPTFRMMRRSGRISEYISIFYNASHCAIYIATDGGRVCRPYIVVEHQQSKVSSHHLALLADGLMNFDHFLNQGLVEFLDVNEENNASIALLDRDINAFTTHLELEAFTLLSACAGLIPYPHHNQSPRNTYQCAMGKQATGAIAYNQFWRMDTLLNLLVYPQKPLCKTKTIELIGFDKLPAGQNATVMVASYSGYDIEDAMILNKASIDRGFGRAIILRRQPVILKAYADYNAEEIRNPPADRSAFKNMHALSPDGIVGPGERVNVGDILVNKYSPPSINGPLDNSASDKSAWKRTPETFKGPVPLYIDKVLLTRNQDDFLTIKVQTKHCRRPELGDKFSSRHGQKGVVGLIVNQSDMPFTDSGICPDIIMNPHGFPSRMTVGKMIELLAGKAGVLEGTLRDGTAFAGDKVEVLADVLVKHGFNYSGKDYITSGITGEPLEAFIFCGPVYYQKLKHMVLDKMHARERGRREIVTRQPTKGRSKDGGFRVGEMERDCLIGYGASAVVQERLLTSSDDYNASVCRKCGLVSSANFCRFCRSSDTISTVRMPFACKLLFQELQAMNIKPRIQLGEMD